MSWSSVAPTRVSAAATVQRLVAEEDDFTTRKALLRVFVEQIRVEAKTSIYPFGCPPPRVRLMSELVGASGIEPETSAMSTQRSYQLSYAPTDRKSVV